MKLYFSRHGESEANRLHIISNRQLPHPLTETGKEQATALAQRLHSEPIKRIYTSPIPRALETAEIVSAALDVPYEPSDALREYDCGILEGRSDAEAWTEHRRWVGNWLAGRDQDQGPQGGETYQDIQTRFVPFIEALVRQNQKISSEFILIGHGGTYLFGLPSVLDNVDYDFILSHGLGNAQIITAGLRSCKLTCLAWEPLDPILDPSAPGK